MSANLPSSARIVVRDNLAMGAVSALVVGLWVYVLPLMAHHRVGSIDVRAIPPAFLCLTFVSVYFASRTIILSTDGIEIRHLFGLFKDRRPAGALRAIEKVSGGVICLRFWIHKPEIVYSHQTGFNNLLPYASPVDDPR